jgi:hypothetical protein
MRDPQPLTVHRRTTFARDPNLEYAIADVRREGCEALTDIAAFYGIHPATLRRYCNGNP